MNLLDRLRRLEQQQTGSGVAFDWERAGDVLGLTADDLTEARSIAIPPGTTELDAARIVADRYGLHPGDVIAEAKQIAAQLEGVAA